MTKWIFLLVYSCLFAVTEIFGQTSVQTMRMTTDFIPSTDQRRDYNKQLCALVKIQVVDAITDVEGNVMGDIVNKGVEKWVYMAKGSKNMKIHLANNLPVTVTFSKFKIKSLEANRVYELVLKVANKPEANIHEGKGNDLKLKVTPTNATIYLWSDNLERKAYGTQDDGTLKVHLPYGRYNYQAQAKGFHDTEGSVFVSDEDTWTVIDMSPIMGTLVVYTPDKKADYRINGQDIKKTKNSNTWTRQMVPGNYTVEEWKRGNVTMRQTVEIVAEQTTTVDWRQGLTPQPTATAGGQTLILNYEPVEAMILVDSKSYKGNGRVELQLPLGEHRYIIAADGYITAEGTVKLNGGSVREITEKLSADTGSAQKGNGNYYTNNNNNQSAAPVIAKEILNENFSFYYQGVKFKCKAKDGIVSIIGFDTSKSDVVIPAQVELRGNIYPVEEVKIGMSFSRYKTERLTIEEGIKRIGNNSFFQFTKLVEISLPSSLTFIGKNVFPDNDSLNFKTKLIIDADKLKRGNAIEISQ